MVQGTVRKEDSINATVSPSLKKKVVELVESGEYSSMSDVVTQGIYGEIRENEREYLRIGYRGAVDADMPHEFPFLSCTAMIRSPGLVSSASFRR